VDATESIAGSKEKNPSQEGFKKMSSPEVGGESDEG
jgi:hypothetical protein